MNQEQLEALVDRMLAEKVSALEAKVEELTKELAAKSEPCDRATLVVFSGDMDKLFAAFIIATGAAAMGMQVSMYFTFWGLTAIKKKTIIKGKPLPEKMIAAMLPGGPASVGTSRMNMFGIGPRFFKMLMKKRNVETLPDLRDTARELEVKMIACQMSMDVMGIKQEELLDDIEYGGVATYLADASDSKITLFI